MSDATETVMLPTRIIERVEHRVARTEFESTAEYITYVIEEVLYQVEQETDDEVAVDEAEVEDRLKSLGYLNE